MQFPLRMTIPHHLLGRYLIHLGQAPDGLAPFLSYGEAARVRMLRRLLPQ